MGPKTFQRTSSYPLLPGISQGARQIHLGLLLHIFILLLFWLLECCLVTKAKHIVPMTKCDYVVASNFLIL